MHGKRVAGFIALVVLAALPLLADSPGVYAITGGTVHPANGPEIANGTVIIRDGLIEAVGAGIAIPADATTIDAKGSHVYPGLFDAQTSLGFAAPAPPRRRGGGGGGASAQASTPPPPDTTPASLAAQNVRLSEDDLDAKRASGVTTILTVPAAGIFNGQSVILDLGEGDPESRVVRTPASLQISFAPRNAWTYPDSLMGVISYIRQSFLDAQQYSAARAIYDKSPAGLRRPDDSPSSVALGSALRKDVPVVFIADSAAMMRRALTLATEFNVRPILSGGRQAYAMADELKRAGVPLLVSVRWPIAPAEKEDRDEQPLRLIRERQSAPTSPAVLAKSGVPFALVSGSAKTGELLSGVRKAIENGLSADDALRALTISPAHIFGVDRQLGSLERGKIANVVISDKGLFDKDAKVKHIFVDGREIRLPADDAKKRGGASSSADGGALDGTWSVSVRTPDGDVSFSMTLKVDDGKVTGSYSGERGSGDIKSGSFDGTAVELTINARGKAEQEDWVFHGTLSGTSMTGTVSTNSGTFQFSGSKGK
jgi:imidazolonepropionase-like amidohydrolase